MGMSGQVVETKKTVESANPAVPSVRPKRVAPAPVDLHTQYAYVINDLRNMAVLAAAMMIVLVILSFFI
jgi:hypothetical protein